MSTPISSASPAPARTKSSVRGSPVATCAIKAAPCGASSPARSESNVSSPKKPCAPAVSSATSTSRTAGLVVLVAFDPAAREELSLPDDVLAVHAAWVAAL